MLKFLHACDLSHTMMIIVVLLIRDSVTIVIVFLKIILVLRNVREEPRILEAERR